MMLYIIILIEFVSIYIAIGLWRSEKSRKYKALLTLILFLPIFGPVFYFFVTDIPPSLPIDKQNRAHRGYYTDQWATKKKELKAKIKKLENENNDKNNT